MGDHKKRTREANKNTKHIQIIDAKRGKTRVAKSRLGSVFASDWLFRWREVFSNQSQSVVKATLVRKLCTVRLTRKLAINQTAKENQLRSKTFLKTYSHGNQSLQISPLSSSFCSFSLAGIYSCPSHFFEDYCERKCAAVVWTPCRLSKLQVEWDSRRLKTRQALSNHRYKSPNVICPLITELN